MLQTIRVRALKNSSNDPLIQNMSEPYGIKHIPAHERKTKNQSHFKYFYDA